MARQYKVGDTVEVFNSTGAYVPVTITKFNGRKFTADYVFVARTEVFRVGAIKCIWEGV